MLTLSTLITSWIEINHNEHVDVDFIEQKVLNFTLINYFNEVKHSCRAKR